MNHIFPYIFYTFSKMYRAGLDKLHPHIGASALLSLLQAFSVIVIVYPYLSRSNGQYICASIILGIVLINFFIFDAKSLEKFDKRWDNEPKNKRFFKRSLVILYALASFIAPIYIVWNK